MKAWLIVLGASLCFLARGQDIGLHLPVHDSTHILIPDLPKTKLGIPNPVYTDYTIHSNVRTVFTSPYNYADDLGFFCKWELQVDKKTKQPVRFRLGSFDYVNHLEGKGFLQKNIHR